MAFIAARFLRLFTLTSDLSVATAANECTINMTEKPGQSLVCRGAKLDVNRASVDAATLRDAARHTASRRMHSALTSLCHNNGRKIGRFCYDARDRRAKDTV